MSFKGYAPIDASVTATVGLILAASLAPVSSADGMEVTSVLVRNTGSNPVDAFPGDLDDASCVFGKGWPMAVGGYLTFSKVDKDLPNAGLKGICGTGLTSTTSVLRS